MCDIVRLVGTLNGYIAVPVVSVGMSKTTNRHLVYELSQVVLLDHVVACYSVLSGSSLLYSIIFGSSVLLCIMSV